MEHTKWIRIGNQPSELSTLLSWSTMCTSSYCGLTVAQSQGSRRYCMNESYGLESIECRVVYLLYVVISIYKSQNPLPHWLITKSQEPPNRWFDFFGQLVLPLDYQKENFGCARRKSVTEYIEDTSATDCSGALDLHRTTPRRSE